MTNFIKIIHFFLLAQVTLSNDPFAELTFDSQTDMPISMWRWKPLVEAPFDIGRVPKALQNRANDYLTYAGIFRDYESKDYDFEYLQHCLEETSFLTKDYNSLKTVLEKPIKIYPKAVSMLCVTHRPHDLNLTLENFHRQKEVEKELVMVLNGYDYDLRATQDTVDHYLKENPQNLGKIKIYEARDKALGGALNFGCSKCSHPIITKMDADDLYGSRYLIDMMQAFNSNNCLMGGIHRHICYFAETKKAYSLIEGRSPINAFTKGLYLPGPTQSFDKDVLKITDFGEKKKSGVDMYFWNNFPKAQKHLCYSWDVFNFILLRNKCQKVRQLHTWQANGFERDLVLQSKYVEGFFIN